MLNKGPKEVDTSAALAEYFLISDCRKNVRMRKIKERKGISSDEKQRGEERWGKPHASSKEPKRPEEKKRKEKEKTLVLLYCCSWISECLLLPLFDCTPSTIFTFHQSSQQHPRAEQSREETPSKCLNFSVVFLLKNGLSGGCRIVRRGKTCPFY